MVSEFDALGAQVVLCNYRNVRRLCSVTTVTCVPRSRARARVGKAGCARAMGRGNAQKKPFSTAAQIPWRSLLRRRIAPAVSRGQPHSMPNCPREDPRAIGANGIRIGRGFRILLAPELCAAGEEPLVQLIRSRAANGPAAWLIISRGATVAPMTKPAAS